MFVFLVVLLTSCGRVPDFWTEAKPGQKRVLVSFPPLYSIAYAVGGDDVYVLCLLTSVGPHDYEGTQTDVYKVNKADLLIFNGLTLDDTFIRKMKINNSNKNLVTLDLGAALDALDEELPKGEGRIIRGVKYKHDDHWHIGDDPHYWLSPEVAKVMTDLIAGKLGKLDPEHAKAFEKRALAYKKELDDLLAYGKSAFAAKKNKKVISMHDSLKYFANAFELHAESIQKTPGAEPDAARITELRHLIRKEGIRVIAIEPQYKRTMAEMLRDSMKSEGIDMQIITIDPLETAPTLKGSVNPDPKFYVDQMRANIDTLAKALP